MSNADYKRMMEKKAADALRQQQREERLATVAAKQEAAAALKAAATNEFRERAASTQAGTAVSGDVANAHAHERRLAMCYSTRALREWEAVAWRRSRGGRGPVTPTCDFVRLQHKKESAAGEWVSKKVSTSYKTKNWARMREARDKRSGEGDSQANNQVR